MTRADKRWIREFINAEQMRLAEEVERDFAFLKTMSLVLDPCEVLSLQITGLMLEWAHER
jgi:hypothetical protein